MTHYHRRSCKMVGCEVPLVNCYSAATYVPSCSLCWHLCQMSLLCSKLCQHYVHSLNSRTKPLQVVSKYQYSDTTVMHKQLATDVMLTWCVMNLCACSYQYKSVFSYCQMITCPSLAQDTILLAWWLKHTSRTLSE